jgi:hypothetical protein
MSQENPVRRNHLRIARIFVLLGVVLGAAAVVVLLWTRDSLLRASTLVRAVRDIQPGKSTFLDAERFASQYGGHSEDTCNQAQCRFDFFVDNSPLHQLKLAPWTRLTISLLVRDGRVTEINLSMLSRRSGTVFGNPFGASVTDKGCYPCYTGQQAYFLKVDSDEKSRPDKIIVELSTVSTEAERNAAYAINVQCLSRLAGCTNLQQFLPDVWPGASSVQPPSPI